MSIEYLKFEIEIKFLTEGFISVFFNNTLRGGFGYSLKKTVCLTGEKNCRNCILFNTCPYVYIFETHPPENSKVLKNITNICQPFVFYTPYTYGMSMKTQKLKSNLTLYLTLFGKAIELFPYFVFALMRLGEEGLGKEKIKFSIENINTENKSVFNRNEGNFIKKFNTKKIEIPISYDSDNNMDLRINLLSPTRIQKNGVILAKPDSQAFLKTLMRRIYNIALFHCGVDIPWDYRDISDKFSKTSVVWDKTETVWTDRYSTRQNQRITMRGIIGEFTMKNFPSSLLPLIEAGEILHIGKNTDFGFGKYKINTGGQIA